MRVEGVGVRVTGVGVKEVDECSKVEQVGD